MYEAEGSTSRQVKVVHRCQHHDVVVFERLVKGSLVTISVCTRPLHVLWIILEGVTFGAVALCGKRHAANVFMLMLLLCSSAI